jgi:hypothetical protein
VGGAIVVTTIVKEGVIGTSMTRYGGVEQIGSGYTLEV